MADTAIRGVLQTPTPRVPPQGPGHVDALARFGRLASVGQSAESIGYQMTDLLSAIQGRCDLAASREDGGVDDIRHAKLLAARCAEMVRRLLAFTRGQAQRWSCSLRRVVDRMESDLSLRHLSDVPMRVDIPKDVRVACPPTQLQQAIQNLVLFARETIGRGEGQIEVRARARKRYVTIEVAHDGPGIPESVREHLFEPFAAPEAGGLGLELYIARCVVEAHEGVLGFFSTPERGTTFRIVLPVLEEPLAA